MKNEPILDQIGYNARMEKSIMDKLFFVDKIDPEVVLDFGCSNGALIHHLSQWMPQTQFIGYDNNPLMFKSAPQFERVFYCSKWEQALERLGLFSNKKKAIVLSSVIHEIYHYGDADEVDCFWKMIFETGFDYIVIRDMIPSRSMDRLSDVNDVRKVLYHFNHTQKLQLFQMHWGTIENNRQLIHFLLKYGYNDNWNREVKENYFPLYREDLLAMIPPEYNIVYHEHYTLPYIYRSVKADVGIEIKDPTHLKLILERQ